MTYQGGLSHQPGEPTARTAVLSQGGQQGATGVTRATGGGRGGGGGGATGRGRGGVSRSLAAAGSQSPSSCLGNRVMNLSVYSLLAHRADRRTGVRCA